MQNTKKTSPLLSLVNRLVSKGKHEAAIDLLESAIWNFPNNSSFLSALGRIYLLIGKPEKAAVHLRRSLIKPNDNVMKKNDYVSEYLTDADADFIEEQAVSLSNDEYSILDDPDLYENNQDVPSKDVSVKLGLKPRSDKEDKPQVADSAGPKITIIKRRRLKVERELHIDQSESNDESIDDVNSIEPAESFFDLSGQVTDTTTTLDTESQLDDFNEYFQDHNLPILEMHLNQNESILDCHNDDESEADNADFELLNDDEYLDIDGVCVDFDDDFDEANLETEFAEDFLFSDFDDESVDWENLDDIEEISRHNEDKDLKLTGVSREDRARQVAIEVLERVGWDRKYLFMLEDIFIESGWGATRIAIENQIYMGAVPEDIALAAHARSIWIGNEHLWTVFRMKSNATFMQAEAVYKNYSWADAMRLIRCFPSIPNETEIQAFIDEVFEEWYNSNRLRKQFKAFLKYFRYRIFLINNELPGNLNFLFSLPMHEGYGGVDNLDLLNEISDMRYELRMLGAESGFEVPRFENSFKASSREETVYIKRIKNEPS